MNPRLMRLFRRRIRKVNGEKVRISPTTGRIKRINVNWIAFIRKNTKKVNWVISRELKGR
jgi:hypothetical protein